MYYSEGEEILEYSTIFTATSTIGAITSDSYFPTIGAYYTIKLNNTEYNHILAEESNSNKNQIILSISRNDLGFIFDLQNENEFYYHIDDESEYYNQTITLEILSEPIIHQIPEKYIPDSAKGLSPEEKVQFTEALAKLETIDEGAEVNVQADWSATEGAAQILNKPELSPVATSGSYNDLTGIPVLSCLILVDRVTGLQYTLAVENGSLITYRAINGISVATPPTKTTYKVGESFDPTGMKVVANYADGGVQEIEDYTIAAPAPTSAGTYSVEISYTAVETYKTNVEVEYIGVSGIAVTTLPNKTSYVTTDTELDLTGMVVNLMWSNGEIKEAVADYTVLAPDFEVEGAQDVTVAYGDYTTTFKISVLPQMLQDFEAIANEDGTYTLTGWNGTLNGEPSTELIIPDDERIIL